MVSTGIVVLLVRRLGLGVIQPQSFSHWWRASYGGGLGDSIDPAAGLYAPDPPLFQALNRLLFLLPLERLGLSELGQMQLLMLVGGGLTLLWCWGRGNLWSAGLWGFSPWVTTWIVEPNGELLSGLLLLWGSVTALPGRFIWLGLACGLSSRSWPLALLLALLWTSQTWPRFRFLGLYVVLGSIVLVLIWLGAPPWLGIPDWEGASLPFWTSLITALTPLLLPFGLTLVRLGWPWTQRHHALVALATVTYMGIPLIGLRLQQPQDLWIQNIPQWGLVTLPLICYVAGGVLEELPVGWRRGLGNLLLVSSLALSFQTLGFIPKQDLFSSPSRAAVAWLQSHREQISTPIIVESAVIAYRSEFATEQLLSSTAAKKLYGTLLPDFVEWIVIDQTEAMAWHRSPLLQTHPDFWRTDYVQGWQLMFSNQQIVPPAEDYELQVPHTSSLTSAGRLPIVRIWRRVDP